MKAMSADEIKRFVEAGFFGHAKSVLEIKENIQSNDDWSRYYGNGWSVINPKDGVIAIQMGGNEALFVEESDNGFKFYKWGDGSVEEI